MYNNFYATPFMAQGYSQVPLKPKNTNPLTKEQAAELHNKGGALQLMPTKEEMLQGICTHRDLNTGLPALINNGDGTVTCAVCHTTFNTIEVSQDQVKEATSVIVDILENTKALYLDIPEDVCAQYFKILPLVKKIPDLYKVASDNFKQYEGINPMSVEGTANMFNQYNMLTGAVAPSMYMYPQQQMMPMQQQAPQQQIMQPMPQQQMMMQQPQVDMYGYPVQQQYSPQMMQMVQEAPGANPFYQQQPAAQQQVMYAPPVTVGDMQQAQAAAAQQAAAPQAQQVEVEKKFNV